MADLSKVRGIVSLLFLGGMVSLWGGLPREVEQAYVQRYENKALFLKIPVRGIRQVIVVGSGETLLDRSNATAPLAFKVGDQVRITKVDFRSDSVRFDISSIDFSREAEILFQFSNSLQAGFPQQSAFDAALQFSFTEGLSYKEIDSAKEDFIKDQYDQLLQQFAATTGTSPEFVVKAISEKNPEYRAARKEAAEAKSRLQELSQRLNEEKSVRQALESDAGQLKRQLNEARSGARSLERERGELEKERDSLQNRVEKLEKSNRDYERQSAQLSRQINEAMKNLETESASNLELGRKMEALGSNVNNLRQERANLSDRLGELNRQLEALQRDREELASDLEKTRRENARLKEDISELTSDRESLRSNYLTTKRQKEVLETADTLSSALHLKKRVEDRPEGRFQVSDVYLHDHRIGTLEIQFPEHSGETYPVRFLMVSPDTVQFSEEERRLHQSLGEELAIETSWQVDSNTLKAVLDDQSPVKRIKAREKAEWRWSFEGSLSQPAEVLLKVNLLDAHDNSIALTSEAFTLSPTGILAGLSQSFSLVSLVAGALLGAAFLGIVMGLKDRSRPSRKPVPQEPYVAQKKL